LVLPFFTAAFLVAPFRAAFAIIYFSQQVATAMPFNDMFKQQQ
jgi:hypothetical protein